MKDSPSPETPLILSQTLTLDIQDQAFSQILESAYYQENQEKPGYIAIVREVLKLSSGKEKVVFELIAPHETQKISKFRVWFLAIRAPRLLTSLGLFLTLLSLGLFLQLPLQLPSAFIAFLAVLFLQVAVNIFNDISDYKRLIDTPGSSRGSGVLQKGWLSPRHLRGGAYLSLALGIGIGFPLAYLHPQCPTLLFLGFLGILGVFFYSQEGIGLKYWGFGDITVFLLLGPCLSMGYSLILFQQILPSTYVLGFLFGLASWGILFAHNLQNLTWDLSHQVKTLPTALGFNRSRLLFPLLYLVFCLTFLSALCFSLFPPVFALCLFPLFPVMWKSSQECFKASGSNSPFLHQLRKQAAAFHFIFGLSFVLLCWAHLLWRLF
jgi:1,4-dihydroxy-2-naphthoate octaprenyltransferase